MSGPILNDNHPVHQLMLRTLQRQGGVLKVGTVVHPNIDINDVRYGLSRLGLGLDHTLGEQVLVFCDMSSDPKGDPLTSFLMVSDRRLFGTVGWGSDAVCNVRFSEIDFVQRKKGVLLGELKLVAGREVHDLSFGEIEDMLHAFVGPLTQEPKENREPRQKPLCEPNDEDPTGATTALSWMPLPDPRTTVILTYLREAHRKGVMPVEIARDFVARTTLAYRNLCLGRGMTQGRHMSPVSANDLSQLMVHMYGNPLQHTEQPVRTLVLATKLRSNVGAAALSSAVGLASLAVLGIGWTRRAAPSAASFQFMVADTGSFASYRLLQTNSTQGLEKKVPGFVDDIHYNLMSLEDALLLRRCVHGWTGGAIELMSADPGDLVQRLTDVIGPFDPNMLGRKV